MQASTRHALKTRAYHQQQHKPPKAQLPRVPATPAGTAGFNGCLIHSSRTAFCRRRRHTTISLAGMLMPARIAATLTKIGGVHRHDAAGRLKQTRRADYWGARYSQNYPHPKNPPKCTCPRHRSSLTRQSSCSDSAARTIIHMAETTTLHVKRCGKVAGRSSMSNSPCDECVAGIVGIIQCPVPVRPSRIINATWRANRLAKLVLLTSSIGITPQFPFPDPNPFVDIPTSIHRRRPSIWAPRGVILCITGMGISL